MSRGGSIKENDIDSLRRRIRLIVLLDSAEQAGIAPIPILRLHTFAYMSNVLAPVWKMPVLDGKVLKRRGGPFYPELQHDLDRLVGMGIATISNLSYVRDQEKRWRLEGSYHLNHQFSGPILKEFRKYKEERNLASFLLELAYALSALTDIELDKTTMEDATYSDRLISDGNVVDFAEWREVNHSANAARMFENLLPNNVKATPSEMLHLYVRHLKERLNGGE